MYVHPDSSLCEEGPGFLRLSLQDAPATAAAATGFLFCVADTAAATAADAAVGKETDQLLRGSKKRRSGLGILQQQRPIDQPHLTLFGLKPP